MNIEINKQGYTKDWLLTTAQGQKLLEQSKALLERPECACREPKPTLYIAKRRNLFYLARMPGTSRLHAEGCQSHIVSNSAMQTSAGLLTELWCTAGIENLPDDSRYWAQVRSALYLAAGKIIVDGALLSTRLLLPKPFIQEKAKELEKANHAFYENSNGNTGVNRYWTVGIIKSITPAKFSHRMVIKHMPGLSFWVSEDIVAKLPVPSNDQMLIAMFSGHLVKTGVSVTDIAGILITSVFSQATQSISAPIGDVVDEQSETPCGDNKIVCVAQKLGMPVNTPCHIVLERLVEHFLSPVTSQP